MQNMNDFALTKSDAYVIFDVIINANQQYPMWLQKGCYSNYGCTW